MKSILITILTSFFLAYCYNPQKKSDSGNDKFELVPELRKNFEKSKCAFVNPDTSLYNIILRNAKSATKIIGNDNKISIAGEYKFYSKLEGETLTLTQHPGDVKNQISIVKVKKSVKASYGYKQLNTATFTTEKGIKLGLTKKQIIEKLGNCYASIDSSKNYIELYYSIETPKDSKSNILKNSNMPKYYASYKLWNDRLEEFEFGFEYP